MTEPRRCPGCGHNALHTVLDRPRGAGVRLLRCDECRGVLAGRYAVSSALGHYHETHPMMVECPSVHRCRQCRATMPTGTLYCTSCGAALAAQCPKCLERMTFVKLGEVYLDVCRACELAFFDRGEFVQVCRHSQAFLRALDKPSEAHTSAWTSVALDALTHVPPELLLHGAHAVGSVAMKGAEVAAETLSDADLGAILESVGEASLAGAEFASQAGEAAAEAVLGILGELFSG